MNQWTSSKSQIFPPELWDAVNFEEATVDPESLVYGVDLNPERNSGSIVTADREGNANVIEAGLKPAELQARTIELATETPGWVAIDVKGPAANLIREMEQEGIKVRHYSQAPVPPEPGTKRGREEMSLTQACGSFYDRVGRKELHLQRHLALDAAIAAAEQRTVQDAWVWNRKESAADVSPLVALTMALHLATRMGGALIYKPGEDEADQGDGGPSSEWRRARGIPG